MKRHRYVIVLRSARTLKISSEAYIRDALSYNRAYLAWLRAQQNAWKRGKGKLSVRYSERLIQDDIKYIEQRYLKPLMRDLRYTPRHRVYPKDYPIKFVSDKQRRFVMAKLAGKPYKRTGKLQRGWHYSIKPDKHGRIMLRIWNESPIAKYVVGEVGLGTSMRSAKRYRQSIQAYHRQGGWRPAQDRVDKMLKRMRLDVKIDKLPITLNNEVGKL